MDQILMRINRFELSNKAGKGPNYFSDEFYVRHNLLNSEIKWIFVRIIVKFRDLWGSKKLKYSLTYPPLPLMENLQSIVGYPPGGHCQQKQVVFQSKWTKSLCICVLTVWVEQQSRQGTQLFQQWGLGPAQLAEFWNKKEFSKNNSKTFRAWVNND